MTLPRHRLGLCILLAAQGVLAEPRIVGGGTHLYAPGLRALAFDPDDRTLVTCGDSVVVWDVATHTEVGRDEHTNNGRTDCDRVVVSRDRILYAGGGLSALDARGRWLWDFSTYGRSFVLGAAGFSAFECSTGASCLTIRTGPEPRAPASDDLRSIKVDIRPEEGPLLSRDGSAVFLGGRGLVTRVDLANLGRTTLWSGGGEEELVPVRDTPTGLWLLRGGRSLERLADGKLEAVAELPGALGVDVSADGTRVVACEPEQRVTRVISLSKPGESVTVRTGPCEPTALSSDGRTVAVGDRGAVRIVDVATGTVRSLEGDSHGAITSLDSSSDGRRLAWTNAHGEAWVADQEASARQVATGAQAIVFALDGKGVVVALPDGIDRRIDPASGEVLAEWHEAQPPRTLDEWRVRSDSGLVCFDSKTSRALVQRDGVALVVGPGAGWKLGGGVEKVSDRSPSRCALPSLKAARALAKRLHATSMDLRDGRTVSLAPENWAREALVVVDDRVPRLCLPEADDGRSCVRTHEEKVVSLGAAHDAVTTWHLAADGLTVFAGTKAGAVLRGQPAPVWRLSKSEWNPGLEKALAAGSERFVVETSVVERSKPDEDEEPRGRSPASTSCRLVLVRAPRELSPLPFETCSGLMRGLRGVLPPRRVRTGGLAYDVGYGGEWRLGERVVLDESEGIDTAPSDECTDSRHTTVVSVVGPWFTTYTTSLMSCGGGSYHEENWRTVDAKSGEAPDLATLVDLETLRAALQANELDLGNTALLSLPFAPVSWNAQAGTARLAFGTQPAYCGMCVNEVRPIVVEVPVRGELRDALERAGPDAVFYVPPKK